MADVLTDAALDREGLGRGGVGMGRIGVEGDGLGQRIEQRMQHRQPVRRRACDVLRAKARISSLGSVSGVSRRNSEGGKGSNVPLTTPLVSSISTSPSTWTTSRSSGPSAVRVWVTLPKASTWQVSGQSADTSIRQPMTYCPSVLRGVRRRVWITPVTGQE